MTKHNSREREKSEADSIVYSLWSALLPIAETYRIGHLQLDYLLLKRQGNTLNHTQHLAKRGIWSKERRTICIFFCSVYRFVFLSLSLRFLFSSLDYFFSVSSKKAWSRALLYSSTRLFLLLFFYLFVWLTDNQSVTRRDDVPLKGLAAAAHCSVRPARLPRETLKDTTAREKQK